MYRNNSVPTSSSSMLGGLEVEKDKLVFLQKQIPATLSD